MWWMAFMKKNYKNLKCGISFQIGFLKINHEHYGRTCILRTYTTSSAAVKLLHSHETLTWGSTLHLVQSIIRNSGVSSNVLSPMTQPTVTIGCLILTCHTPCHPLQAPHNNQMCTCIIIPIYRWETLGSGRLNHFPMSSKSKCKI